jgi:hypothetical protein
MYWRTRGESSVADLDKTKQSTEKSSLRGFEQSNSYLGMVQKESTHTFQSILVDFEPVDSS